METKNNNNVATATETKNIVENLANGAAPTKTATAAPTKTEKKAEVKVEKPAAKVAKPKVEKPAAKTAAPKKAEKATAAPKKATADKKAADNKKAAAPKKAEKKVADKKATAAPKKAEKKVATPTNKKATAAPKKVEVKEVNPAIEKARKALQKNELSYILSKVIVAGLEQRLSREMKAEIENANAQGKRVQPRYSTYHSAALSKETLETLKSMGIDYEQDCNGKGHRFRFFVPRKGTKAYKALFGE